MGALNFAIRLLLVLAGLALVVALVMFLAVRTGGAP